LRKLRLVTNEIGHREKENREKNKKVNPELKEASPVETTI